MKKIDLGIVGLGILSQTVHLPSFYKNKNFKLRALCDHNKNLLNPISYKYNIKNTYTDINQMIKNEKLDAIACIVQRPNTFKIAKKILASNINLFVEKPVALNSFEAKTLVKLQKRKNLKLVISYMKRSDNAVIYLKKLLQKKNYGDLLFTSYQSFIGRPKPREKEFFQHQSKLRRKKYSLNKTNLSRKKIFEKYLNSQCHSINLLRFLFGKINIKNVNLSKQGEGSVVFESKKKDLIELTNKYLLDEKIFECLSLNFSKGVIQLFLQNPFKKNSYSKVIIKKGKEILSVKYFKNWCFKNQSQNLFNYLKNNKKSVLSTANEGMEDIKIVEKIFKKL